MDFIFCPVEINGRSMLLTYELHERDGEYAIYLGRDPKENPIFFPLEAGRVRKIQEATDAAVKYQYDGRLYFGTEDDFRKFAQQA